MITRGMANIMSDVQKLDVDLKGYSQRFHRLEEMCQHIMDSVNTRLTNDDEGESCSSTTEDSVNIVSSEARLKVRFNSWSRVRMLGRGSFGTVYECISDDGLFFAVKEVSLVDQDSNAKQSIYQLEQERNKLYIFLELVTQGSLASLYQKCNLRESQVCAYTKYILTGLKYLHDRNVIHRDIKCANILVDAHGLIKLADFGLAKKTSKLNELKSCKGSAYWMAPEVVNPRKSYWLPADIWSLGCTVIEMLTRTHPYGGLELHQAIWKVGRGEPPPFPDSLSRETKDFVQQCLQVEPEDRPAADKLLNHPFVKRSFPVDRHIMDSVNTRMTNDAESNSLMLQEMSTDQILFGKDEDTNAVEASGSGAQVPDLPSFVVGLENVISDVKRILFQVGVDIVGIKGIGGSGKSTLALALCEDTQVKDSFQNNIIFITVSQQPDVKAILETMWVKLIGRQRPGFQSIEEAHRQLQTNLKLRPFKPTLVVLDNVWSRLNLEDLLFEAKGYKTIITTRHNFTVPMKHSSRLYELPMLQRADALSLFCFWAFGKPSIPETEDENLVKEFERECKGLPLALKIIGTSLCGEPCSVWESAKRKLSRAEPISEYHKEGLLNCLETSIDVLDDDVRHCFLDLGAFPKGRKFRVDALLDIWVYVHGMERQDAFDVLLELARRNLLNLTSSPGGQSISYGFAYELSFSQHDVMWDLALRLANQDSTGNSKRLFMPKKEDGIPRKWLTQDQSFNAKIVSIHTGAMDQKQWGQMDFPEAEALILFFDASEYYLPPFLQKMSKLKVQLICNYNSKRTMVNGLASLHSPTQIKSVHLERLIVPPLYECWESLEKLSICLCEGLGNMIGLDKDKGLNFPKLVEMNLDHCIDLEDLPSKICDLTSLQRLCVTNCHLVHKLPDDLGRLRLLKLLRLSACPSLAMLPVSICKLGQLEFLDISSCMFLKDLPMEFNNLSNLKTLDMRECSGLRQLPKALDKLRSLIHVICDEKAERQWRSVKTYAMPRLKLEVAEESFNLDWLDD